MYYSTVTITSDPNTIVQGETSIQVEKGETVTLPQAQPKNIAYAFSKWVDDDKGTDFNESTPITTDMTVKAMSAARAANPPSWFTVNSSGELTGFTDEYGNMVDAPTDLVLPRQVGGVVVTGIAANAYLGRSAITSIVLPSTLKSIGASAFKNCGSLTGMLIPSTVTAIGVDAFSGCNDLLLDMSHLAPYSLDNAPWGLPRANITWGAGEAWDTYPMTKGEATKYGFTVTDGGLNVLHIKDEALVGEVYIPSSIDGEKVAKLHTASSRPMGCGDKSKITKLIIPASVQTIEESTFTWCTVLTEVVFEGSGIVLEESVFKGNSNLSKVTGFSGVSAVGDYAFRDCARLSGDIDLSGVVSVGRLAFYGCAGITSLAFSEKLESLGSGSLELHALETLDLSDCNKLTEFNEVLRGNILKSVILPDSITGAVSVKYCPALTQLNIPKGVTVLDSYAFSSCTALETIDIPSNVTSIAVDSFNGCTALKVINVDKPANFISGAPWGATNATINWLG